MSTDILIGDPASIARETERLAATIAANLRHYGRLKRAARNFGDRIAREPRVPLGVLEAWRAVDEVLGEIRRDRKLARGYTGKTCGTREASEEVEAGW